MDNQNTQQEMSQEEYKIRVLKSRIGEMAGNYEEIIANQATTIAALRSRVEFYEEADKLHKEGAKPNGIPLEQFEAQQADQAG